MASQRPAFQAWRVREEINQAVAVVRKSLDATRNPQHPADVPHSYDDKFRVVELASRAALAVQLNTLANGFGLTPEKVQQLQETRGNQTVTLRVTSNTTCAFSETRTREEQSATRFEKQGVFGKTTYQNVTTITEHLWTYSVAWEVVAYLGSDHHTSGLLLASRRASHIMVTRVKDPVSPLPEKRAFDPLETDITWLLDACRTGGGGAVDFDIDRSNPAVCHTPRRNPEVDALLHQSEWLMAFCGNVRAQVERTYRDGFNCLLPPGTEVIDDHVFVPVAVMLALEKKKRHQSSGEEGGGGGTAPGASSPASTFAPQDFEKILALQQHEMQAKFEQMNKVLPSEGIVSTAEAALVVCAGYSVHVWRQYGHAVQAVEGMLMDQLIAAVGQHIGPADFAK
jgi:hypothetical protein